MLKKRIEVLERMTAAQSSQWIQALTDEEFQELAGDITPEEEAGFTSLSTKELEDMRDGKVSLSEYLRKKRVWELKNALNA